MGNYRVAITNPQGETLDLMNSAAYVVTRVTGMNPPKADINTSENAFLDGATFNSAKIKTRNIVISLVVNDPAEPNRIALYNFIKLKRRHLITLENGLRSVQAEGYVESIEVGYFEKRETVQVSFICPDPALYAQAEEQIDFSSVVALFEFPFSIAAEGIPFSEIEANAMRALVNKGDLPTGFIVRFRALGAASNPILVNSNTGEQMQVEAEMTAGQIIEIDTREGHKTVKLIDNGVETNLLNAFIYNSTWMALDAGANVLQVSAGTFPENIETTIIFTAKYEGI